MAIERVQFRGESLTPGQVQDLAGAVGRLRVLLAAEDQACATDAVREGPLSGYSVGQRTPQQVLMLATADLAAVRARRRYRPPRGPFRALFSGIGGKLMIPLVLAVATVGLTKWYELQLDRRKFAFEQGVDLLKHTAGSLAKIEVAAQQFALDLRRENGAKIEPLVAKRLAGEARELESQLLFDLRPITFSHGSSGAYATIHAVFEIRAMRYCLDAVAREVPPVSIIPDFRREAKPNGLTPDQTARIEARISTEPPCAGNFDFETIERVNDEVRALMWSSISGGSFDSVLGATWQDANGH